MQWKKWTEPQRPWDYHKECNICVTGVPERDQKEGSVEKVIEKNNGRKLLKFGKRGKPRDLRSSANPKQKKIKQIYTQMRHNQTAEN